jgi:sulfatase maturation enzyme AslB (radical SAM superfamily)
MREKKTDTEPVNSLVLLLTSGCNLACRYCYRQAGADRRLNWRDLRRNLDWALAAPGDELEFIFSGGEPLLEFNMLSRAVNYLGNLPRAGRPVKLRVLTNGMLLDADRLDLLVRNSVYVNLSFDGVIEAQVQRGKGTWEYLDRLLGMIQDRHPDWFATHLQVTMVLTPRSLPWLADSVEYLVGKKVKSIGVSPVLSRVPGWNDDQFQALDQQLARVFNQGRQFLEETGQVPFRPFRKYKEDDVPPVPEQRACAALDPSNPVLDVDGRLFSCLMFAPSGLDNTEPRLMEIAHDIGLGRVDDQDFEEKRTSFSAGIRNKGLFIASPDLKSDYGHCNDCPAAAVCQICPLSLLEFGQGAAPKKVPALLCAYNFLIVKYHKKFPAQEDPNPPKVTPELIRERMRFWEQVNK